jgi:hypothetical protein
LRPDSFAVHLNNPSKGRRAFSLPFLPFQASSLSRVDKKTGTPISFGSRLTQEIDVETADRLDT